MITPLLVGLGFGFALERAGLGDSRTLAAQFYHTDLTVFKVMFSAILTAMLGLFWSVRLGWAPPDVLTPLTTYALPQVLGGMLFGAGFIVGGFCPGTCCVAGAVGRWDGLTFLAGLFAGTVLFRLGGQPLASFASAHPQEALGLPQVLGLSYPATVAAVVLVAVAAFWGAEHVESLHRTPDAG